MVTVIQNIIFPNLSVCDSEESYIRCFWNAYCDASGGIIYIPTGGEVSLDTFYNSVDIGFWKGHTTIENLSLKLKGTGTAKVTCYIAKNGQADQITDEVDLNLSDDTAIPIDGYSANDFGKIYLKIHALTDSTVESGSFLTNDVSKNAVKLGIVITHYNRKQYVLPVIEKIEREITNRPEFKNKIELVVVDNSQNIQPYEVTSTTVIKNENLGGSGGWARGLIYLKDNDFTHCLFADDDGCYEMECIKRLFSFYSFQKLDDTNLAIAGTLLYQNRPSVVHAKGERCNGFSDVKNHHNENINDFRKLLVADADSFIPNYGAFCFFCFPLSGMKYWPFPFFVKGDDILFGYQNKFRILTISGIACYIDSFVEKRSPMSDYLTYRGRYIRYIQNSKISLKEVLLNFTKKYFGVLFSYKYDSADAILLAHKQMLEGGDIFLNDINLQKTMKSFSRKTMENPRKILRKDIDKRIVVRESKLRKCVRFLTLQGLFLPNFLFNKRAIQQNRGSRAHFRSVFLHKSVYYYSDQDKLGYIANHSKRKLLKGLMQWSKYTAQTSFKLRTSVQKAEKLVADVTTEDFWRIVYNQPKSTEPLPFKKQNETK